MYITEMILEGFKSYPNRTVISAWDPEFNAITGLNGSGKSNILDAICFVLGISNLSQVRASNLQDLVYKRGQAGITKASVTIEFDNSDPNSCPVGYEQYPRITVTRQIVLGGHNKYLINGHNAQQSAVANLFQSVQLNVNNPHFLIMQGRITKVLNMKPPEVLAMIEEAAGTRMFEDKKTSALSTIDKKEKKLKEIQTLLDEEITPKLDKLKKERALFFELERVNSELQRTQHFVVAYQYTQLQTKLDGSKADLEAKTRRISELEKEADAIKSELKVSETELQRVRAQRQKEMGTLLEGLDKKLEKLSEDLVRTKTQCDLKGESVAEDERTIAKLQASIAEAEASVQAKIAELAKLQADFAADKAAFDAKAEEVRKTDDLLSSLTTGVSSGDGEKGYMEQLQAAKNRVGQVASETKQAQLKLDHLKAEVKEIEPKVKQLEKSNTKLQTQLDDVTKALEAAKAKLAKLDFDQAKHEDLARQKAAAEQAVAALRERVDALSDRVSPVRSVMKELESKFTRQQVKGVLAELVNLPAEHRDAATALEVTAGGRLYSIVVQDEKVGSSVLQTPLKRRVLIIPLTKIQRSHLSPEAIAKAKSLAPGRVDVALSLVGYPAEVEAAMDFVFGSTMICKDQEAAKRVTFEGKVRSVTLEGDVYEPAGTISGGSNARGANILLALQELADAQAELSTRQAELAKLTAAVEEGAKKLKQARELQSTVELKSHELTLLQQQIEKSPHAQAQQQLAALRAQMAEQQAVIDSATQREKEAQAEVKRIEKEMKELESNREGKLKALKAQLTKQKQELAAMTKAHKEQQQQQDTLKLEIEQARRDVATLNEQLRAAQASLAEQQAALAVLRGELEQVTAQYNEIKKTQAAERERLAQFDEEVHSLERHIKARTDALEECEIEAKKLSLDVGRYHKERQATAVQLQDLEKHNDWILNQRQPRTRLFGQPGSQFDFAAQDPAQAAKRLEQLQEASQRLSKNVNRKVNTMLERVEKEEKALKEKLATVLNDKYKIEDTIKTLDQKKQEALRKTWEKVNGDFGTIFGDLLPGNTCRLEPPEGQDITDGLEIKVNLGGVWKQSLTELSGGQRSLVALSLILSLLSYKPAPLYILDEIDAALDLSHTQNIGQLLKTRFKGAQFIVVSLKEGMFNNANVLFRARFRDGASQVERIAQARPKAAVKAA